MYEPFKFRGKRVRAISETTLMKKLKIKVNIKVNITLLQLEISPALVIL